jgi:hypothetical protein
MRSHLLRTIHQTFHHFLSLITYTGMIGEVGIEKGVTGSDAVFGIGGGKDGSEKEGMIAELINMV